MSADAPEVEKLVNAIILGALQQKASDIHIEPFEKKLVLRYRVDGSLREAPFGLPYPFRNALIAKIKIMTNQMDITEHRKPQDGRIQVTAKGNPIEFRVNVVPTVFGESCCMRVLGPRLHPGGHEQDGIFAGHAGEIKEDPAASLWA